MSTIHEITCSRRIPVSNASSAWRAKQEFCPFSLRLDFDCYFWFSTVKSNSPKPAEEEEKEKAPQTEESEETGKEEETKMEHWTPTVISLYPSTRFPSADSLLPPLRLTFFDSPPLPSSTVTYMYSFACCFLLPFILSDTEPYASVFVKNSLA